MEKINTDIANYYGNKLRVRVCGILIENNRLLVVEHKNIGENGVFISPPGGGLQLGENIENCLKREFLEETGLVISVERFLFVNEFLDLPLHAIELFFLVKKVNGELRLGTDPEMQPNEQILQRIFFISENELAEMASGSLHQIFTKCKNFEAILTHQSTLFKV
jgi:8-oxo-dGTP diphosphatase